MGVTRYERHSKAIISTRRWAALRLLAKRRDGFRCVACGARGRLEVDHVLPVRTHPEAAWTLDNLQTLCPACHARKTRIDIGLDPLHPERQRWRDLINERKDHA